MMNDLNTVGAVPWYQSPVQIAQLSTFVGALLALAPGLAAKLGLETTEKVNAAVQTVAAVVALGAPVVGMVLRAKSTIQPLTLTQAKADAHPATEAAKAAKTGGGV